MILRSPVLKGCVLANGEIVRDADGLAVRRQAVLTDETWAAVQAALDRASQDHSAVRTDAAYLLRVAFCGCSAPMGKESMTRGGRVYAYYRCSNHAQGLGCTLKRIRADLVEPLIGEVLLDAAGTVPMRSKVVHPAQSHAAEFAAVDEAIAGLQEQLSLGKISVRGGRVNPVGARRGNPPAGRRIQVRRIGQLRLDPRR